MADHWGKIGCHFPAKTNPNADVWNIEFLPKGGSSTSVIDRVYMVPDGVNITSIIDLQHYIVWTTDVTLVPESDAVCIEFVPPYDIPLSNVAIFCNSNESSTSVNFAVFHESGLVVAKNNGDTVTQNVEKFGMTGQRRVTAVSGVTLKKGLKYYIQYTNGNNSFKPVVMDGWYGNYKIFTHGSIQSKNVANLNNAGTWIGIIDNTMGIFNYKPGDFFMWQSSGWTPGLQNGHIYMRSNVGAGLTFTGVVGNPSNPASLTAADVSNLLAKPYQSAFLWYVNNYPNMTSGDIYQKTTNFNPSNTSLFEFNGNNYNAGYTDIGRLMVVFHNGISPLCSAGDLFSSGAVIGRMLSLPSGYTSQVESDTPLTTIPSNPNNGDIYFFKSGVISGDQYAWTDCCYVYNNGGWSSINPDNWRTYIITTGIDTLLTRIGNNSDLTDPQYGGAEWDNSYQSDGLRNATVYTDKKHYLELNGTEV